MPGEVHNLGAARTSFYHLVVEHVEGAERKRAVPNRQHTQAHTDQKVLHLGNKRVSMEIKADLNSYAISTASCTTIVCFLASSCSFKSSSGHAEENA
eukprot:2864104-Rhodomonas_salina.3